jgi:hypothetical protein
MPRSSLRWLAYRPGIKLNDGTTFIGRIQSCRRGSKTAGFGSHAGERNRPDPYRAWSYLIGL